MMDKKIDMEGMGKKKRCSHERDKGKEETE
jgi:hypothetical protein